jgi:tetratricopeptide (TPR) repeat protein
MIGPRLRQLRTGKKLTQRELASPRYTHAYVSSIESGHRTPSHEALEHFAAKLGVSIEELETGRPADLVARLDLRLAEARMSLSDGDFEAARQGFRAVIRDAKRHRLTTIHARAEEGLALGLEREGSPEEAIEHYQQAEMLLIDEPVTALVDAVAGKARCFFSLGDVRYAIYLLEAHLDALVREDLRDPDALAHLHGDLIYLYVEAGLYRKAVGSVDELELLAPRLKDPQRVAHMNMNVARAYLMQGEIERAQRSLQRAEDAYRELGYRNEAGAAHLARGYVLSREGMLPDARTHLELARTAYEETADQKHLPRALNELARVERLEGRLDRARGLLERSIALIGTNDTPILAWAHRELGEVLVELDPSAAEKRFRIAIELYELAEQSVDIAVTYRALGDLLQARGDSDGSCESYRTGILALEPHL